MYHNRKKTLNEVRRILRTTASPLSPFNSDPRTAMAALWAAPVMIGGLMLSYAFIGLLAAISVFAVVRKMTPPETWSERFCKLLTDYQPLDENSYQALLTKIKANTANRDDISTWLIVEAAHVERPGKVAAERALLDKRLEQG